MGNIDDTLIDFDPDSSPDNPINREAAEQRGLTFSYHNNNYVDEDGCLVRDRYGQEY